MPLRFKTLCRQLVLLIIVSASPFVSQAQDPTPGNPDANPLPISLTAFAASSVQKGTASIEWQTSSETNASHFNVQRSFTGSSFTTIARQAAVGNSTATNSYSYTDNYTNTITNFIYYRLQNVDKNGSSTYSNIVKINVGGTSLQKLSSYPNPMVNNSFTVDVAQNITAPIAYKMINTNGQMVKQGTITQRQQVVTCNALPKGNYLLQLATGQTVQITK